jgi:hypothetical protein
VVILVIVAKTTMITVVLARIMILVIVSLTMVNVYLFREMVPGTTFAFGAFCELRLLGILRSSHRAGGSGIMLIVERVSPPLPSGGSERR